MNADINPHALVLAIGIIFAVINAAYWIRLISKEIWKSTELVRLEKLLLQYFVEYHERELYYTAVRRAADHWVFSYDDLPSNIVTGRILSLTGYRCLVDNTVNLVLQDVPKTPGKRVENLEVENVPQSA